MPVYQLLVLRPSPGDASRFARLLQQTEHAHFTVTPATSVEVASLYRLFTSCNASGRLSRRG
jgi:hypothetical protein